MEFSIHEENVEGFETGNLNSRRDVFGTILTENGSRTCLKGGGIFPNVEIITAGVAS